jgi:acetyltransferase-like isoleucine patch superfamily enzyme
MDVVPWSSFRLGKKSVIESYSCINNACGDVIIGEHTRVGIHNTIIGPVTIGSHVNIAQGVVITALNHNFANPSKLIDTQGVTTRPIIIDDDVWIGANATITPGVSIGAHSVIGAGAVVTHDIPAGSVAYGSPAKVMKTIIPRKIP